MLKQEFCRRHQVDPDWLDLLILETYEAQGESVDPQTMTSLDEETCQRLLAVLSADGNALSGTPETNPNKDNEDKKGELTPQQSQFLENRQSSGAVSEGVTEVLEELHAQEGFSLGYFLAALEEAAVEAGRSKYKREQIQDRLLESSARIRNLQAVDPLEILEKYGIPSAETSKQEGAETCTAPLEDFRKQTSGFLQNLSRKP